MLQSEALQMYDFKLIKLYESEFYSTKLLHISLRILIGMISDHVGYNDRQVLFVRLYVLP